MPLIKPISSLSVARAVNLYALILCLSFGALLYWLAADRHQSFIDSHAAKANTATRIAAFQINRAFNTKKHSVDIFIESSTELIKKVIKKPKNAYLLRKLISKLKKYQPDVISFSIMNQIGNPIVSSKTPLSEFCIDDVKYFLSHDEQKIRLHHHLDTHHYDLISPYTINGIEHIFFFSFYADEIVEIFDSLQPQHHNLMLVNTKENNLIEITSEASKSLTNNRTDTRMSGEDKIRTLSANSVKSTDWKVVDIRDDKLFSDFREKVTFEYFMAFYALLIIVLFMRFILLNQDKKRTKAEEKLQENHKKIVELNSRLDQLSKTDDLTNLYNRRYFTEMSAMEWNRGLRSGSSLSCIMFDIDYFKSYNDSYGHQAGDSCLQEISTLLKDSFSRATDIVARYGGEEFIVVIADSTTESAIASIKNFQTELEKLRIPHQTSDASEFVTLSAGVVNQTPSRDETMEDVIRKADEALYLAKSEGRNRYVVHQ